MKVDKHQVNQCQNEACNFRFPSGSHDPVLKRCPKCGGLLKTYQYDISDVKMIPPMKSEKTVEIHGLLDNIRSVFNVGSIFRSADGCGVKSLYLCGITTTPEHPKLKKTGLGSEYSVEWSFHNNAVIKAQELHQNHSFLLGIEEDSRALPLKECLMDLPQTPIVLIVGNEISGIDPILRHLCDRTVFIPMQGYKKSLNVGIAFSIVAYFLRYGLLK